MIDNLSEENKSLQDKIEALKAKVDKHELQKYVLSQQSSNSIKKQSSENHELKNQLTSLKSQISAKDLDAEFFKGDAEGQNKDKVLEEIKEDPEKIDAPEVKGAVDDSEPKTIQVSVEHMQSLLAAID